MFSTIKEIVDQVARLGFILAPVVHVYPVEKMNARSHVTYVM